MSAGRDEAATHDAENENENAADRPLLERWTRIGDDYVVNKLIGRGGQSQIYEGYDTRNERLVAIKVFLFKHQLNAAMLKRAKAEAKAEMRIAHPNIVKVYAAGVAEIQGPDGRTRELFYSVMEFLEGETLDDRVHRKGPLDVRETLWILAEAADGLAMLHASRIVHRDVKPENIFLAKPADGGSEDRVVLIDLGIAKLDPQQFSVQRTDSNILLGTFAYMSPEQIHHKCPVDGRADLYALGIVAFKCLAGVHPAWNHHVQPSPPPAEEYAAWHMTVVPPLVSRLRPDVPDGVAQLVARLVAKTPDERYADAKSAAVAAVADLREQIAEAEANPTPPPAVPPNRRLVAAALASPSERWRPLGDATTQEDEGNDGPTAPGAVPVRLREPAPAPAAKKLEERAPVPAAKRLEAPAPVPPAREPLRTTAGTEILEVTAASPAHVLAQAPVPSRAAGGEVERTRTGTEIVPRQRLALLGLGSGPPAASNVPAVPAPPALVPGEPATRIERLPSAQAPSLPFRPPPAEVGAAPAGTAEGRGTASGGTRTEGAEGGTQAAGPPKEPRTTSGHLMSVAPPAPRTSPPRLAWVFAAVVGVLCGVLVLAVRSPRAPASPPADANPIVVALPEPDAGGSAAASASAETPDAGSPDAAPASAERPDGGTEAPDAGTATARPRGEGAPPGQRVCDFIRNGCAPAGDCAGDESDPRCNRARATAAQKSELCGLHPDLPACAPPKAARPAAAASSAPPAVPSAVPAASSTSGPHNKLPRNIAPQPLPAHDRIKD